MLVLSRKAGESIIIDGNIRVTVSLIQGDRVKIGIEAPKHIKVNREEVAARIEAESDTQLEFACR
ncbi:carbon storage regulator CsrA [Limnoglobus roseus]|uniref:Translational regulator CsrA n=1 Tax=Limnoglobus roseus TaxID=2598579 RepID=A0A5C1AD69_9BACT|nr:carbon storage regulator CsrA [Limnoglobus roseus]QEL14998.1 carbon storage regulator [Limnoglobus roseus]